MTKVFISREIRKNYPFYNYFKNSGIQYQGESLIQFSPLSFELNEVYDWYFFYSKNGWKFLKKQLKTEELERHLRKQKIAAIGPGTAEKVENSGYECAFIGKGNPQKTVQKFTDQIQKDDKIVCIRAKSSSDSIKNKLLNLHYDVESIPVYDNTQMKNIEIDFHNIAVITSSRNAQFYKELYGNKNQEIIAIGNPTSQALIDLGFKNITKSPHPSEKYLAETLKNKIHNY